VGPLSAFQLFASVKVVGVTDMGHAEGAPIPRGQLAQPFVEAVAAEQEAGVHQRSLCVFLGRKLSGIGAPLRFDVVKSTPLENSAVMKVQVAFDEKLRRPVKAFLEGRRFGGQARMQFSGAEGFREPAECLVPRLPEDEHRRRLRCRAGWHRHP